MRLTILGSGTHIPVKHRSNPAYLLDINNETILLDCGSGTLRQLAKANRSEWEIDKIFLSHLHIDHTMDLIPLFFTFKYQLDNFHTEKEIPIYAHRIFADMIMDLEKIYGNWINGEKRRYKHIPTKPNQQIFDNFKIETFSANHAEHSVIYRFTDDNNKVFVYSGDTGQTEDLIRAAYRADLLLIEGTNSDKSKLDGHLSANDIKNVIKQSNPAKTIITHISPENDNDYFRNEFNGLNIEIAEDLLVIDL